MGLKVPRYDKLQLTIRNLWDNLTVFSWREYVVRSPSPAGGGSLKQFVVSADCVSPGHVPLPL